MLQRVVLHNLVIPKRGVEEEEEEEEGEEKEEWEEEKKEEEEEEEGYIILFMTMLELQGCPTPTKILKIQLWSWPQIEVHFYIFWQVTSEHFVCLYWTFDSSRVPNILICLVK